MLLHRIHPLPRIYRIQNLTQKITFSYPTQVRFYRNEIAAFLANFPDVISQQKYEKFWSDIWDKSRLFERRNEGEESFRLLLPPPNITGDLHLGTFFY